MSFLSNKPTKLLTTKRTLTGHTGVVDLDEENYKGLVGASSALGIYGHGSNNNGNLVTNFPSLIGGSGRQYRPPTNRRRRRRKAPAAAAAAGKRRRRPKRAPKKRKSVKKTRKTVVKRKSTKKRASRKKTIFQKCSAT